LNNKKILFIVEGEKTEPSLMRRLNKIIGFTNYEIFSYNTSIYELYEELTEDDNLDLVLTLKESAKTRAEIGVLSQKYVSIYLIFDFDPHYQKYSKENLKEMLTYFNSSYDRGKLYINYPMMESFRDLRSMPDHAFLLRQMKVSDLTKYKEQVGKLSDYTEMNKYDFKIVMEMITHHLRKYHLLVKRKISIPSENDFLNYNYLSDIKLLEIQSNNVQNGCVSVINTSVFYLIDLKPKTFFNCQFSKFVLKTSAK